MSTRLVTLLWLLALALLGVSGERDATNMVVSEIAASQIVASYSPHHIASRTVATVHAHRAQPPGDFTSSDSIRHGHLSTHRSVPGVSKRVALTGEDIVLTGTIDVFAQAPAIVSIASPPLIHNPARAPPA